jgi:tripartite-type tricarboxylate transporter receptor subunit TctC
MLGSEKRTIKMTKQIFASGCKKARHDSCFDSAVSVMWALTIGLVLLIFGGLANAADSTGSASYPVRPVRIVIQFPPGGSDTVARIVAQKMSDQTGQTFVIDNRPGAAGVIGANLVAKAAPDGYTVLFATASFAMTAAFNKKLPYDSVKDFDSVGFIGSQPFVLVVNPNLGINSVKEWIVLSKTKVFNYGSTGTGGAGHLTHELFNSMAGIKSIHIPYKGTGPLVTALAAGEVAVGMPNISGVWGQVRAGKLKALGVSSIKRTAFAPELPTIAESGVAGYESATWYGLTSPSGTPVSAINELNKQMTVALKKPEIREKLAAIGVDAEPSTPHEFSEYMRQEINKWSRIIKEAKIQDE